MKKWIWILIVSAVFAGCNKNQDDTYTVFRWRNNHLLLTRKGGETFTSCKKDTSYKEYDNFAKITGEFDEVRDSFIIQYGHVWSITSTTPYLITKDSNFTDKGKRAYNQKGKFESVITKLTPETKYYVRSYIIRGYIDGGGRKKGWDTAYGQYVYSKKTTPPINYWFKKKHPTWNGREGAVGFSLTYIDKVTNKLRNGIFVGLGQQSITKFNDFWEYNPVDSTWRSISNFLGSARTEAVSFTIADKAYVGSGEDNIGLTDDFYCYEANVGRWIKIAQFPGTKIKGAVAFGVNNKGYVGTGESTVTSRDDFYEFTPPAINTTGTGSWRTVTNFGGGMRKYASAFSVENIGFVTCGTDNNGNFYKDLWAFSIDANGLDLGSWSYMGTIPGNARANAVAFAADYKGFIGTGSALVNAKDTIYSDFYSYDPYNRVWKTIRPHKNGETRADENFAGPAVTNAVGISTFDRGYVTTGYLGPAAVSKYSVYFWVYRP